MVGGPNRPVFFGLYAVRYVRCYAFPDIKRTRRKVGLRFVPVEFRGLIELVEGMDGRKAAFLARPWRDETDQVIKPSIEDIQQPASVYLAHEDIIVERNGKAVTVNCLEVSHSL